MKTILSALVAVALSGSPSLGYAAGLAPLVATTPVAEADPVVREDQQLAAARQAILELERSDPGLARLFGGSAGFAVFATVRSGGAGGAHGEGVLFEDGLPVGALQLSEAAAVPGRGARTYTEVIFFESAVALDGFKSVGFDMGASVVQVNAAARASTEAISPDGLSVFTLSWVGPPAGAEVGGQRFAFRPFLPRLATSAR